MFFGRPAKPELPLDCLAKRFEARSPERASRFYASVAMLQPAAMLVSYAQIGFVQKLCVFLDPPKGFVHTRGSKPVDDDDLVENVREMNSAFNAS